MKALLIILVAISMEVNAKFPPAYKWLWQPARYKVAHGGRWSWKSTSVARYVILKCIESKIRVLCAREFYQSIEESVHALLCEQIEYLKLEEFFIINKASIDCTNGSHIFFGGINKNSRNKKSMQGVSLCWIEEADQVSEETWQDLTPTIRKENSEILITFNRKYLDNATDKRFVQDKPNNSIVYEINYTDVYEGELPQILQDEIADCKRRDPSLITYNHVYLNKPTGIGAKIWTAFNRESHVLNPGHWLYSQITMETIAEKADCFMAMDPHSKYYPFCGWLAMIPKNSRNEEFYYVFYNEWPTVDFLGDYYSELRKKMYFDGSIEDLSKQIYLNDGTAEYGIQIKSRYMDTRFAKGAGGENWSTSTTGIVHEFSKLENGGLIFNLPAEVTIDRQRNVIIDKMKYNTLIPLNEFNSPDVYFMPNCRNIIQSAENHRCIEGTEKEDEKYKDPSDMMRIMFAGIEDHKYTRVRSSTKKPRQKSGWMG
jgi:hypothetical protein